MPTQRDRFRAAKEAAKAVARERSWTVIGDPWNLYLRLDCMEPLTGLSIQGNGVRIRVANASGDLGVLQAMLAVVSPFLEGSAP